MQLIEQGYLKLGDRTLHYRVIHSARGYQWQYRNKPFPSELQENEAVGTTGRMYGGSIRPYKNIEDCYADLRDHFSWCYCVKRRDFDSVAVVTYWVDETGAKIV